MKKETGRKIITFDWAIKTVLRDKTNFDVLEGFLTALLGRPIVILDLLESEGNRVDDSDKYNHVDLLAKTEDDERIIVEVQYLSEMAYLKRLAYGTAKTIVENLRLGDSYTRVRKVYSVSLLYFDVTEDDDDYIYHGKTEFMGFHTHKRVTLKKSLVGDQVRIGERNVFPEYFLIPVKHFRDVVRDDLDQWVYAFKNNEVLDEFTAPGIGALKEKFDYLKLDERERRRFEAHIDRVRSEWGMIADARQEGLEKGARRDAGKGVRKDVKKSGNAMRRKENSSSELCMTRGWPLRLLPYPSGFPNQRYAGCLMMDDAAIPLTIGAAHPCAGLPGEERNPYLDSAGAGAAGAAGAA